MITYDAVRWFGGVGPAMGYKEIAVIQPNVAQKIKWDEHYSRQILDHVFTMNAAATKPSTDLVVWPETAIPYYVDEQRTFHLTEMGKLPGGKTPILTGLLTSSRDYLGTMHYFNAAALFNSLGEMDEAEEDLLDRAWGLTPVSRLSCQAKVGDSKLVIEIPKYTINYAKEITK